MPNRTTPFADAEWPFPLSEQPVGLVSGRAGQRPPGRISIDPDNARKGLMQLVLTLVELLRELLERQAMRRIDGGSLSQPEIERMGRTFLRLAEEMERLKQDCGLSDEDLNLNLGPLGRLR